MTLVAKREKLKSNKRFLLEKYSLDKSTYKLYLSNLQDTVEEVKQINSTSNSVIKQRFAKEVRAIHLSDDHGENSDSFDSDYEFNIYSKRRQKTYPLESATDGVRNLRFSSKEAETKGSVRPRRLVKPSRLRRDSEKGKINSRGYPRHKGIVSIMERE